MEWWNTVKSLYDISSLIIVACYPAFGLYNISKIYGDNNINMHHINSAENCLNSNCCTIRSCFVWQCNWVSAIQSSTWFATVYCQSISCSEVTFSHSNPVAEMETVIFWFVCIVDSPSGVYVSSKPKALILFYSVFLYFLQVILLLQRSACLLHFGSFPNIVQY